MIALCAAVRVCASERKTLMKTSRVPFMQPELSLAVNVTQAGKLAFKQTKRRSLNTLAYTAANGDAQP